MSLPSLAGLSINVDTGILDLPDAVVADMLSGKNVRDLCSAVNKLAQLSIGYRNISAWSEIADVYSMPDRPKAGASITTWRDYVVGWCAKIKPGFDPMNGHTFVHNSLADALFDDDLVGFQWIVRVHGVANLTRPVVDFLNNDIIEYGHDVRFLAALWQFHNSLPQSRMARSLLVALAVRANNADAMRWILQTLREEADVAVLSGRNRDWEMIKLINYRNNLFARLLHHALTNLNQTNYLTLFPIISRYLTQPGEGGRMLIWHAIQYDDGAMINYYDAHYNYTADDIHTVLSWFPVAPHGAIMDVLQNIIVRDS